MSKTVTINGAHYALIVDYKTNQFQRNSFNLLTERTYGFDFESWFNLGYWGNNYIPYSLLKDDIIVANVSVNIIDFSIIGETKRFLQIGTVMTDENLRNQGLSKSLMDLILEEWEGKCDLIYLFANDSVLDYYPKFGFVRIREYQCSKTAPFIGKAGKVRQLDMSTSTDQKLLYDMASSTVVLSKVSMLDNANLVLFYCTSFMSSHVFYIEEYNAIAVAEFEEDICYLQDVFSENYVAIDDIIAAVVKSNTSTVIFGFTPNQESNYDIGFLANDVDTLFVKPDIAELFKTHKLRFPLLSHA